MWDWTPHLHPEVWALCGAILAGYFLALRARRGRTAEPPATRSQVILFSLGVLTLFVAAEWPLHDVAEGSLYSAHMVQHMLLTLVAPPLLMAGTPAWMARALLPGPVLGIARRLARPFVALVIFNVVLVFTHWPMIVEASVGSELWHFLLHVLIVTSAFIMWAPVLSPLLEIPRLSYPGQMVYLFLQSIVPTVPASFLTFGDRPLYTVYELLPKIWGIDALADQRAAGLIMKIAGGFLLWGFIAAIFFRWARMEREDGMDALAWRDVERSLDRMELKKI